MLNKNPVRLFLFVPCLLLLLCSQHSLALKPEHEGKRLLLAAKQALENNNPALAEQQLAKAKLLRTELPPEYDYYRARVLIHHGRRDEARRSLERYVDSTGSQGEFYEDALTRITQLNQKPTKNNAAGGNQLDSSRAELKWSSPSRSGKAYTDHLQVLYMTASPVEALVVHINNLLDFYAYADQRIIASTKMAEATRHRIRATGKGEIVTTTQSVPVDKKHPAEEDRFPVFGINPYVDFHCSAGTASCWMVHPHSSRDWLQIVQNKEAANELSKALTQLIKNLQKGG